MGLQVATNFAASTGCTGKVEPVAGRMGRAVGNDINDFAAFQFVVQRHHAGYQAITLRIAVSALRDDACPCAPVPHFRVDAVGEIERC